MPPERARVITEGIGIRGRTVPRRHPVTVRVPAAYTNLSLLVLLRELRLLLQNIVLNSRLGPEIGNELSDLSIGEGHVVRNAGHHGPAHHLRVGQRTQPLAILDGLKHLLVREAADAGGYVRGEVVGHDKGSAGLAKIYAACQGLAAEAGGGMRSAFFMRVEFPHAFAEVGL